MSDMQLDVATRILKIDGDRLYIGTAGDMGAEKFTILAPNAVDNGILIRNCDVYMSCENVTSGYTCLDSISTLKVVDKNNIELAWQPSNPLFYYPGIVRINLCLFRETSGKVTWAWQSRPIEAYVTPRASSTAQALPPQQGTIVLSGFTVKGVD